MAAHINTMRRTCVPRIAYIGSDQQLETVRFFLGPLPLDHGHRNDRHGGDGAVH